MKIKTSRDKIMSSENGNNKKLLRLERSVEKRF